MSNNDKVLLRKGTLITCPECGLLIGYLKKDIHHGDTIYKDDIVYYEPSAVRDDMLICPRCNCPLFIEAVIFGIRTALIHTDRGWQPKIAGVFPGDELVNYFVKNELKKKVLSILKRNKL